MDNNDELSQWSRAVTTAQETNSLYSFRFAFRKKKMLWKDFKQSIKFPRNVLQWQGAKVY